MVVMLVDIIGGLGMSVGTARSSSKDILSQIILSTNMSCWAECFSAGRPVTEKDETNLPSSVYLRTLPDEPWLSGQINSYFFLRL